MKKICLSAIMLLGLLVSCTDENDIVQEESTAKFKNYFESNSQQKGGGGFEVVLDIGRPSRGCIGFGVCNLTIGIVIISHKLDENQATALWVENGNQDFAQLELEAPLPSGLSTNIIIEQDVVDSNSGYYIPAGTYSLNSNIGNFGGYLLPLHEL